MDCAKSGWVTDDGTRRVIVAQRAEKVITAVLELKDFVSQGLKFDVTGYGTPAWSVITLGVQVG